MSEASRHWKLGLSLALTTSICWGLLPIALTICLTAADAYTITWFRFLTAALILGAWLARNHNLPHLKTVLHTRLGLFCIALAGLAGNFTLYLIGLHLTTPTISQIVGQLSPVFLLLGGVLVFREHLSAQRWIGFTLLLGGMLFFFNRRLPELIHVTGPLGYGVAILASASLVWASYALAQKQLLKKLDSPQILFLLYGGAAIVLLPLASPADLARLNLLQGGMLTFCCLNTLVAYGALAEALKYWEVARVSAVLSLTPLFTLASTWLFTQAWPGIIRPEQLNALSIAGTLLVVFGSAVTALGASQSN